MRPPVNASLNDWLAYIGSVHASEIELGLARVQQVAERLGLISNGAFVFTVAGTNGKGTTTAALSALSLAAGKTVGWYSSPHLRLFNERMRVNGELASDSDIIAALAAVDDARGEISLSYFEYTTLAAMWLFKRERLDVWVLEVGLGGRLDAVNVIDPSVSVITNIGLDHQDYLGNTLAEIGREKAGICRHDTSVVFGSLDMPSSVFEVIEAVGAIPHVYSETHGVIGDAVFWQDTQVKHHEKVNLENLPLANVAAALQAFALAPFELSTEKAMLALSDIRFPGRMQKLTFKGRQFVLDVGHNPHAGAYIASQLKPKKCHAIIGMLADKDASGFLMALSSVVDGVSFVTLDVPRGRTAESLATVFKPSACFCSIKNAIDAALSHPSQQPIFIGGSFYTVAAALDYLEQ